MKKINIIFFLLIVYSCKKNKQHSCFVKTTKIENIEASCPGVLSTEKINASSEEIILKGNISDVKKECKRKESISTQYDYNNCYAKKTTTIIETEFIE